MSHECTDCGESFETLSRLRIHDCALDSSGDTADESAPAANSRSDLETVANTYSKYVGDLPELIDKARDGDLGVLFQSIAEYETALKQVPENGSPGQSNPHNDILFAYFEPLADGLDAAAQANGWDALSEFVDAYDPRTGDQLPQVTHVIANAVGRSLVRTRLTGDIESVPPEVLAYLGVIPEYCDEFAVAYEDAYTYGWGIGHPDHSVSDQLRTLAETEHKWLQTTLNTAFHADQQAAVAALERLATDDSLTGTVQRMSYETDLTHHCFGAVANLKQKFVGPHVPMYWEFETEFEYAFELQPEVEQRIRELARQTGVAETLPENWQLHELDPGPLSDLTEVVGESPDRDS